MAPWWVLRERSDQFRGNPLDSIHWTVFNESPLNGQLVTTIESRSIGFDEH